MAEQQDSPAPDEKTVAFTIDVDGKSYDVPYVPFEEVVADLYQYILRNRRDPIAILAEQTSKLQHRPDMVEWLKKQAEPAVQEFIKTGGASFKQTSYEELLAYIDAPINLLQCNVIILRKAHPEVTEEQAMRAFLMKDLTILRDMRDKATEDR